MRGCQAIRAGDGKLLWQFDEWVLEGDEWVFKDIIATENCVVLEYEPYFSEGFSVEVYLSLDGDYIDQEAFG